MEMLLLWLVGILAMVVFPISLTWLLFILGQLPLPRRRFVEHRTALLTPILWLAIVFFPAPYEGRGQDYELWLTVWSAKTFLFIFTPSVLALFIAKNSTGEIDTVHAKAAYRERFTKVILGVIVLAVGMFLLSMHQAWHRVAVVSLLTLFISLVAYPVSLMLRPLIIRISGRANKEVAN